MKNFRYKTGYEIPSQSVCFYRNFGKDDPLQVGADHQPVRAALQNLQLACRLHTHLWRHQQHYFTIFK